MARSRPSASVPLGALHEEEQFFAAPARFRLAFRELGTCLGIRCHLSRIPRETEQEKERAYWTALAEKVISAWALSLDGSPPLVPPGLRAITLVMYASALIPGGELRYIHYMACAMCSHTDADRVPPVAFAKGFFGGEFRASNSPVAHARVRVVG